MDSCKENLRFTNNINKNIHLCPAFSIYNLREGLKKEKDLRNS